MGNREYLGLLLTCGVLASNDDIVEKSLERLCSTPIEIQELAEYLKKDKYIKTDFIIRFCDAIVSRVKDENEYRKCVGKIKTILESCKIDDIKRNYKESVSLTENMIKMIILNTKLKSIDIFSALDLTKIIYSLLYTQFELGDKKYRIVHTHNESYVIDTCTHKTVGYAPEGNGLVTLIKGYEVVSYTYRKGRLRELLERLKYENYDMMLVDNYMDTIRVMLKISETRNGYSG